DTLSKQDVNSINELTKKRIQNHEQVIDSLNEKGIEAIKKKDYTLVYHGMEVELPSNKIDTLRKMEDIKAVHKNKIVHANLDTSVPLIRAPETWEEEDEDGLQVTGKGVTVGVVDTGIDYTHPDLGNGIGKDYKVLGGYNYIDDSSDPMDDHGHGTHVAGIVAADGEVTGVAPDASLVAYKVLDNQGKGEISGILEAL